MAYHWQLPQRVDQQALDKFPELHPVVVQLLYNRGLTTQEQIDEFLYPDYSQDVHDPGLFLEMDKACQRIYQAIEQGELITVFGDYDADGVSAAIILTTILKKLGGKVEAYLPHREREGYGLNVEAVKELANLSTKLLITCDCGITNVSEVDLANSLQVDVIITDHHSIGEKIPAALAIIHPQFRADKYPCKNLAGGGVAFKLVQGLLRHQRNQLVEEEKEKQEKWLLDLVAISTVADMVPLLGENRTLVKYGLIVLRKSSRVGLQQMMTVANVNKDKLDTRTIGFAIAPRINAAGRMDHANLAYYLLNEENEIEARKLAEQLNQANLERQRLTEQVVSQAQTQPINDDDKLLIFYQPDWPAGLTGLAAGRLVKVYNRPCIVMTDNQDNIIGSGRSVDEFDITKALQQHENLLIKYGGHPQAAGFTFAKVNLDKFIKGLKDLANQQLKKVELEKKLNIELEVELTKINWELVDLLDKFQPFGHGNPEPLFLSPDVLITAARRVGKEAKHWKLELVKANKKLDAIAFGQGDLALEIGHRVDIVYNLSINEWNGNREIQLIIKDVHPVK